ncbi:MAG TPA: hypothetical protein VFG59_10785 [Anaeromyxobacter sp.]|nr:hypothetical protein [Anaeromyxobacter sp.]
MPLGWGSRRWGCGTFTYSLTGEQSIVANATVNVRWRSDIHEWRRAPHLTPVRYGRPVGATNDSSCSISASGNAVETPPMGEPLTLGVSAGLSVPPASLNNAGTPPYFGAGLLLDVDSGSLLDLSIVTTDSAVSVTGNVCSGPEPFLIEYLVDIQQGSWQQLAADGTVTSTQPFAGLPVQIDGSYGIAAGQFTGSTSGCPYSISTTTSWKFSWPTIAVSSPPDPTAAQ